MTMSQWHKALLMEHPKRLELTREELQERM